MKISRGCTRMVQVNFENYIELVKNNVYYSIMDKYDE